jgi:hypothetical protein
MENPKYWRNKNFNYSLRVEVGSDGRVIGSVPVGVRNFVEQQQSSSSTEGLLVSPLLRVVTENTFG